MTKKEVNLVVNLRELLKVFDYTNDEIYYGISMAVSEHKEDHLNGAIRYIERDLKKNPKYM